MNDQHSFDLIKAIYLLTDQLQFIANGLERIEAQLSSISSEIADAGINISNTIEEKP
jgi:hypothetical protein